MTNNELSRKVLVILLENEGSIRFKVLLEKIGADARAVFKNLFFLEEKGYVQLSTSYASDAVYPQILLVRMRDPGEETAQDPSLMDSAFPLSDTTTDTKPHIPPDLDETDPLTYGQALENLAMCVRKVMEGEEGGAALEKIESLLGLPFINDPIKEAGTVTED